MGQAIYPADDPLWYKDAIIYEMHVRAFYDSDGDGIGDFKGAIQKLDYLKDLGINAIWLLPICPSPLLDDGYDISDYKNIHPDYGTLRDFKEFLRQAHKRGIRVITELTLNPTSNQHPWFKRARSAPPGSPQRDYYVWSDTPEKYRDARIIFRDFENSNWTLDKEAGAYYWHRFYHHQPDLNYDNPKVREEITDVIDFWFDLGVDGLRLDAVPYLYEEEGTNCENLPRTHAFLKELRAHVDRKYKNRMLLAEANQWPEDALAYFGGGDECHMAFNFPVMPRLFMAIQMEDSFPIIDIFDPPLEIPESCQWAIFLRNHDELTLEMVTDEERDYMYRVYATDPRTKINLGIRRRLAPLLGNNIRKIELMNVLLLSLPGTPIIYYGDELGMGDNFYLGDRKGVRTPMQWSSDRNASFSTANPQKLYLPLITDPEYNYEAINVENQEANLTSSLWRMRRLIAMRKEFQAFGRGKMKFLSSPNPKVLAFVREMEEVALLVVINLSRFCQPLELDLSGYAGLVPEELFSRNAFPMIKETPYPMTLGPHSYFWFELKKAPAAETGIKEREIPSLSLGDVAELMEGRQSRDFLNRVLPDYLKSCRWFRSKGRPIRQVTIIENAPIDSDQPFAWLWLLEVRYGEGMPEIYLLPVYYLGGEKAANIEEQSPPAIIARLKIGEESGILMDGIYSDNFHGRILEMIERRKKFKGKAGSFFAYPGQQLRELAAGKERPFKTGVAKVEQTNSSIIYDEALFLKLYRKLEEGKHPDVELVRALTEKAGSKEIPAYAGMIEYQRTGAEPLFVGLLQAFVPNQGEAWGFALDHFGHYYERILAQKDVLKIEGLEKEVLEGFFPEMIALLGQRAAKLHLSLASIKEDPDFAPEPFTTYYQRSVFQSMRSMSRQSFSLLKNRQNRLEGELKALADEVLAREGEVEKRFARVMEKKVAAMKIRIHGDFHLGQVLFTGKDFLFIDFEGEPARPLSERRLKRSALRDLASMVRSFHYAAYAALFRHPSLRPEDRQFLEAWIKELYNYLSKIFLRSYLKTVGAASFIPQDEEEFNTLFDAYLLEKAVYELGYELNNRPDWVIIPLKGIKDII